MKARLPKFEGVAVEAATLRVSGSIGERVGALASGEELFVILRAVVTDVAHGVKADVMTRQHRATTIVAVLLEPGQGARLLEEALVLADERFGIRDLFHPGDDPG